MHWDGLLREARARISIRMRRKTQIFSCLRQVLQSTEENSLRRLDILMKNILHIWKIRISDTVQGFTATRTGMRRRRLFTMWEAARAVPGIISFKTRYSSRNNVYLIYKNMPLLQIILNLPFLAAGFLIKFLFFAVKGMGKEYAGRYQEWFFHQPQRTEKSRFR